MSFLPGQPLLTIIENVASEQSRSKERLSSVIPMDEIVSFHESRLLDVIIVEEGLVMRSAIPLASIQTALFSLISGFFDGTGLGDQIETRNAFYDDIGR